MKKSFIVIGMPRGGTTFLYHNLQRHPDIFVPFRKEVNYFNVNFDRGENWYRNLYKDCKDNQVCADISPPCFMDPDSDQRILDFQANTKTILVVRDPFEWALSFYAQFSSFNYDMMPFEEFVNGYDYQIGDKSLHVTFKDNYIPKRIQQMQDRFGENLLIYPHSILKKDPLKLFNTLERFLDISPYFTAENFDNRKINASGRKNAVWLTRLLSREGMISLIEKTIPRELILSARQKFDSLSVKKSDAPKGLHKESDITLAKTLFAEQQAWVDNLFSEGDFLLGDGSVFTIDPPEALRA